MNNPIWRHCIYRPMRAFYQYWTFVQGLNHSKRNLAQLKQIVRILQPNHKKKENPKILKIVSKIPNKTLSKSRKLQKKHKVRKSENITYIQKRFQNPQGSQKDLIEVEKFSKEPPNLKKFQRSHKFQLFQISQEAPWSKNKVKKNSNDISKSSK